MCSRRLTNPSTGSLPGSLIQRETRSSYGSRLKANEQARWSRLRTFERLTVKYEVCMNNSNTHNQRIAKMTFASVYPMYLKKVEKKGRTKEELHQVIKWLTGFDNNKLQELIKQNVTFEAFFQHASLNP